MEFFRIRFINKIRPDTIEIRYRAVLESHSSDTIFEGHQLFLKNYLDTTILQSGEVALKAIYNIFSATPKDFILDQVSFEQSHDKTLLEVPTKQFFNQYVIDNGVLDRVIHHEDKNGKPVIDTKLVTELRIG